MHSEEVHNLFYSSPNIIKVVKSKEDEAGMEELKENKIIVGKHEFKDHLGDLVI
jgi:hypothetical protein